jgi:Zn-finger nucleic acid-binding protein
MIAMSESIECTHCKKSFHRDLPECPFCGLDRPPEEASQTIAQCPRCKIPLQVHHYRETELDLCPACSGLWLDSDEFNILTSERDVYIDPAVPRACKRKPIPKEEGYLHCPRCDRLMSRRNFKKISGVLIDLCSYHGVWLDAGELDQIRCFIAQGGLEAYQDKHIAENQEKIRSVADSLSGVEFTQWFIQKWNLKYMLKEGLIPKKKNI